MAVPILRPFQSELKGAVYQGWNQGAVNVLMRLDTGGGKTVTLSDIVREHQGWSSIIAHRAELVGQLSLTLARYGVRHNIIAAEKTRRAIAKLHVEELGFCLYDPGARCVVASVDTLVRHDENDAWMKLVTLWIVDEGHHLVLDNKWHTAISRFTHPACRGLLPTATPRRADGKGLGRGQGGVADLMVQGPPMRWLINHGYLTDYRIVCPTSDLEVLAQAGASGDWSTQQLRAAAERSHIVGDVVAQYLHYARGKLGITFATDVKTAAEMTAAYRMAGVRAELLTGKTDDYLRRSILKRFAAREVDQIVAVDIISEGFDLPAIEVASMARPTQSLALYMQQFGRTLRTLEGKGKAIIIDHVGNLIRHNGPPDMPRVWSLDKRGRGPTGDGGVVPITVCVSCFEPYRRSFRACPNCGHYEPPRERSSPEMVAGDMGELDPAVLEQMRAAVGEVDKSHADKLAELSTRGVRDLFARGQLKHHDERQQAQADLRAAMAGFGGQCLIAGMDDTAMQRTFFYTFGIDVLGAQALGAREARVLAGKINSTPLQLFA